MQAIRAGRSDTSKVSTLRAPLSPASNRFQVTSTPQPSGVTIPKPVTTTRLMGPPAWPAGRFLLLCEPAPRSDPLCQRPASERPARECRSRAEALPDNAVQYEPGLWNASTAGSQRTGNLLIPSQILL